MNAFADRLNSPEAWEHLQPMVPGIIAMADKVISAVGKMVSEPSYAPPRSLRFAWNASRAFSAYASLRSGGEHAITISYGVPITAYQDVALLTRFCSEHFLEEKYDELFASIDYGQGRENVLPVGLDPVQARVSFLSASVAWVYLHEQAHLFQNHGEIFARHSGQAAPFSHTDWVDEVQGERSDEGDERDWIRHCFELSADYEATTNAAGVLIVLDNGALTRSSLWLYVAAITCQFRHFYGESRVPQTGHASGSHPNPAVRMKFTFNAWINTLWHSEVRKYVPWAQSPEDLQKVMTHAFHVANLYMTIAYSHSQELPQFLERLYDQTPEYLTYMQGLRERWRVLRPEVVEQYQGSSTSAILPIME